MSKTVEISPMTEMWLRHEITNVRNALKTLCADIREIDAEEKFDWGVMTDREYCSWTREQKKCKGILVTSCHVNNDKYLFAATAKKQENLQEALPIGEMDIDGEILVRRVLFHY
ncbi:MAG: hypothetical protein WC503_06280 [Candidatus Shapirobacteria bacterium]